MTLYNVTDSEFKAYGQILEGYELTSFIKALRGTELPDNGVIYVPSDCALESEGIFAELRDRFFGGMPIQIGYCNGVNSVLNCLEYHRNSEVVIAAQDCILLVAMQSELDGWILNTERVKAFLMPAGAAAELFATTLHYAPCSGKPGAGFQTAIVLPSGTNTQKPFFEAKSHEDKLMTAKNKWLLAHPQSPEAATGAVIGLSGVNIKLEESLW